MNTVMLLKERKCEESTIEPVTVQRYSRNSGHYYEPTSLTPTGLSNGSSQERSGLRDGVNLVVLAMSGTISACTSILIGPSLFPSFESKTIAVDIAEKLLGLDFSVCVTVIELRRYRSTLTRDSQCSLERQVTKVMHSHQRSPLDASKYMHCRLWHFTKIARGVNGAVSLYSL